MASPSSSSGGSGKLDRGELLNTLGKIHGNINKMIGSTQFRGHFTVDYGRTQGRINNVLGQTDKTNEETDKDLTKTEHAIKRTKRSRGLMSTFIFGGPLAGIAFTIVGGLILITLARIAWRKWKKTYMPETDGKKDKVFGFTIPGVGAIKAFAIGIYNFVKFGIPIYIEKLSRFFKGVYEDLFGKSGCLRNVEMIKITAKKLIGAWIIGHTKKVGGALMKIIGKLIAFIPGFGPFAQFIIEFAPEIYTFITTQLMLMWQNKNAEAVAEGEDAARKAKKAATQAFGKLRKQVIRLGRRIKPFAPPEAIPNLMTPNYVPGDIMRNRPKRAAIYRRPTKAKFSNSASSSQEREKTLA